MHVDLVADRSQAIRASLSEGEFTRILTIAFVVMVIFLFLHSFWATVIASIVLPVVGADAPARQTRLARRLLRL